MLWSDSLYLICFIIDPFVIFYSEVPTMFTFDFPTGLVLKIKPMAIVSK